MFIAIAGERQYIFDLNLSAVYASSLEKSQHD